MPRLSVIIPTCDRLDALAVCLEQLAPGVQTLDSSQFEVIVTDDASSGSAATLVERRFSWARWSQGPRRGPAANRNSGARLAQGDWLVFIDDDCVPGKGWLAAYARAAEQDGALALEGRTLADPGFRSIWDEAPANLTGGWFWSCNIAIRRALFAQLGGFDENYRFPAMEDVDLRRALEARSIRPRFTAEAEVAHPAKRVGPYAKWKRLQLLESAVYFAVKWNRSSATAIFAGLCLLVTRQWLINPLRRIRGGGLWLTMMFPAVILRTAMEFPRWHRSSARLLTERPPQNLGASDAGTRGRMFG